MSDVLDFLKSQIGRVLTVKEISKEVDSDRYERDKTWASNELKGLCSKGLVEAINGCYWIPTKEDKNAARLEREREESEQARIEALTEGALVTDADNAEKTDSSEPSATDLIAVEPEAKPQIKIHWKD